MTKTFDQRWEKYRLDNEIEQETFVASGFGFVEYLEEFVALEKEDLLKDLDRATLNVQMPGNIDNQLAREEIRRKYGFSV